MATKVKLIADGVITPDQITLTTASTGTNTTAPATTAFVQQEISALVDSSPDALNTLNELAAALGDDANFSTTVTNSIATKAPLASPTLTGTVTVDTDANSKFTIADGGADAITLYGGAGDELYVGANNAYKLRFKTDGDIVMDNGGSFGIGTSSPSAGLHVETDVNPVLKLDRGSANNTNANLYYNGTLTGQLSAANDEFQISAAGSSTPTTFFTDGSERMRIDSSGNLLVGKTSADDFATAGVQIEPAGQITTSIGGDVALKLNRGTNDGNIIELYKAGSEVGVIASKLSTSGSVMLIGSGDTGIAFENLVLRPRETDNGTSDGAIDLGTSSDRFKDLYLSGKAKTVGADFSGQVQHLAGNVSTYFRPDNARYAQIFMDNNAFNIRGWTSSGEPIKINAPAAGGPILLQSASITKVRIDGDGLKFNSDTAAANALDDYEEGTHTATISCSTSGTVTLYSNINTLNYVKIGKIVHIQGMVTVDSVSSPSGYFTVSLPFAISSWGGVYSGRGTGTIWLNTGSSNNVADYLVLLVQGESSARVYLGDNVGVQSDSANNIGGNDDIYVGLTYLTNT